MPGDIARFQNLVRDALGTGAKDRYSFTETFARTADNSTWSFLVPTMRPRLTKCRHQDCVPFVRPQLRVRKGAVHPAARPLANDRAREWPAQRVVRKRLTSRQQAKCNTAGSPAPRTAAKKAHFGAAPHRACACRCSGTPSTCKYTLWRASAVVLYQYKEYRTVGDSSEEQCGPASHARRTWRDETARRRHRFRISKRKAEFLRLHEHER